jgi:hypothetical protein
MKKIEGIEILKREPDFSGIKWVAKAKDRDCRKKILNNLLFEDGFWIATDGHRMHIYDTDIPYENGLYDILVNNISQLILKKNDIDAKYPNWEEACAVRSQPRNLKLNSHLSIAYTQIVREMDNTIQYEYLKDLLTPLGDIWIASLYQKADPVMFTSNNKIGIIMPVNM